MNKKACLLAVSITALALAGKPAAAQQVTTTADPAGDVASHPNDFQPDSTPRPDAAVNSGADHAKAVNGGDVIIVTAQRREQNVLTVPLSIQAETGQQLINTGIRDLTSLRFNTPGLTTATDSGFTQIFIRGVGNAIYVGADPSVAYFVDDVPRIYGSLADNLFDVERTEILKGAQGGLYGRNATGGVVNVITRQPSTSEVKGDFRVSYGERNSFEAAGYVNVPLSEHIAFSISAERDSHDPYVKNTAIPAPLTAANFPNGSPFGGPAATAAFFNAGVTAPKLNDQDFWSINSKLLIEPASNLKIILTADYYRKHDNNGRAMVTQDPTLSQALITNFFAVVGVQPVFPAGFIQGSTGKYTAALGTTSALNIKEYGFSSNIVWNAPGVDITSITAYRDQQSYTAVDVGNLNINTAPVNVSRDSHYFYQELRAVSTFDGPFHVLGGATYLANRPTGLTNAYLLSTLLPIGTTQVADYIHSWSAYAQVAYDFTDHLTLTASGRYVHETNRAEFTRPVISTTRSVERKFIPAATLSYKLDDGTAYVRWARGFKTGGIDLATAPAFYPRPQDGSVFGPETVDTYEAGYRQALFDRKVQVTAAIFYNDYRNLQVAAHPIIPEISTAVVNAKSARTYGVEGSVSWKIAPPISIGINAGYLNAKYKDFKLSGSTILAPFDRDGERMINAPKLQLAITGNLDQPVNRSLRLVSNVLISHTSSDIFQYTTLPGIVPNAAVPGYWLVNARVGIRSIDDRYGVALVANNLFNAQYFVNANASFVGNNLIYGSPRVIRGEVSFKF